MSEPYSLQPTVYSLSPMRLGIFGGSFDPIHNGHLRLAECCAQQAGLDEVCFIPAGVQPLKPHGPVASNDHRVAMLRLAVEGLAGLVVSTIEIDRGGVSYTVDTLRQIHADRPDARLFFLMGADSLHDLPKWREPEEVLRLATPLVVGRPGEPEPTTEIAHERVEMPPLDISSSELRKRLAAGEACGEWLPSAVAEYLDRHGLYK